MPTRSPNRQSNAVRRSLLGFVVALACALLQVGSALHGLLVAHVVCPVHGDIVHAESAHAALTRGGSRAASNFDRVDSPATSRKRGSAELSQPVEDEHGHDHCLGVAARHAASVVARTSTLLARQVVEAGPPVHPTTGFVGESPMRSRSRRLLEAPKSSPPSASVGSA